MLTALKEKLKRYVRLKIARPLLLKIGNAIGKYSIVGDHPTYNSTSFPWTTEIENNWDIINSELKAILLHHQQLPNLQDIEKEQQILNQDSKWKTFFLYGFGKKATLNCSLCPSTTSLIEKIPGMKTAFFSILSPKKHIPAHKGLFKGIIRSHLGLIIPGEKGECRMRIEGEMIFWKEGKMVIFDDTYEHEVWNDTKEIRVILLIDVVRPFRFPLSSVNNAIVNLIDNSAYIREAFENHAEWEKQFHYNNSKHKTTVNLSNNFV